MREIKKVIIHCSASDDPSQDSVTAIRHLHTSPITEKIKWGKYETTGKAFNDIGYHFVITKDGAIRPGRPLHKPGAHCEGQNEDSVGICLSGENDFRPEQFRSLRFLIKDLCQQFKISPYSVYPHSYFEPKKTCPNFDVTRLIAAQE